MPAFGSSINGLAMIALLICFYDSWVLIGKINLDNSFFVLYKYLKVCMFNFLGFSWLPLFTLQVP